MFKKDNSNESVVEKQTLSVKSSSEILESIKLRSCQQHTTSNVLRNENELKSEIEATTNSPISCLKRDVFGYHIFSQLV